MDHHVTCRHCGVGINYSCDHEESDVPAENLAAEKEANAGLRRDAITVADWIDSGAHVLTDISEAIRCAVVVVLERWKAAAGRKERT